MNSNNTKIQENEVLYINQVYPDYFDLFCITQGRTITIPKDCINNIDAAKNSFSYFDPIQTGDNFPQKVCNVCHRLLPTEQFQINQHGINNRVVRRPSCNDCRDIIDGVPLTQAEKHKWDAVKPFLVPFECPICRKRTIAGLTSKIVLDHNHLTGIGRAWICDSCNTGLGRFKDSIDLLHNAIQFLETN